MNVVQIAKNPNVVVHEPGCSCRKIPGYGTPEFEAAVVRESMIRKYVEPKSAKVHAQYMEGLLTSAEYAEEIVSIYATTAAAVKARMTYVVNVEAQRKTHPPIKPSRTKTHRRTK